MDYYKCFWKIDSYNYNDTNPFKAGDKVQFIQNQLNCTQFPDMYTLNQNGPFKVLTATQNGVYLTIGSGLFHYKRLKFYEEE